MRTKTKYRQAFKEGGRVEPGQAEFIGPPVEQPTEAVSAPPEAPPAEATVEQPPAPPPQPELPQRDDATLALKRQIEGPRHSEQLQRQQAAMPQGPVTREQKLALWRQSGMSDGEAHFLSQHPEMIDHADITAYAANQANQAHQRDTPAHYDAVKKIFDATLNHLQEQAAPPAMPQETPRFFQPPPGPPGRSAPNPSSKFSAPVSRDIPSGGSGKRPTPGKVTLTPSEVEAARVSGVSLEEYAKNKIEYQRQREAGEYRDNREQR